MDESGIDEIAERIEKGHAWKKHKVVEDDLTEIEKLDDFDDNIGDVIDDEDEVKIIDRGRKEYWEETTGTVVIKPMF